MVEQVEVVLIVYNNDDGDFVEVVCVCIVELNVKIDFLIIKVDWLKIFVELNYFLLINCLVLLL